LPNLESNACRNARLAMVEPHLRNIPVSVQADLLGINSTRFYITSHTSQVRRIYH
jgi:hypothetical protein